MSTNTLACTTSTTCAWGGLAAKDTDAIVPSNTTAQAGEDVHLGRDGGQGGVPPPHSELGPGCMLQDRQKLWLRCVRVFSEEHAMFRAEHVLHPRCVCLCAHPLSRWSSSHGC